MTTICKSKNCQRPVRSLGYCPRHYQQLRRHGRLTPESEHAPRSESCIVPGCSDSPKAKDYCPRHYQQLRRHGRLTPESERPDYGRTDCKVPGCNKPHAARGYCKNHYMTRYYNKDFKAEEPVEVIEASVVLVPA